MAPPITPRDSGTDSSRADNQYVDTVSRVTIHEHPDKGPERVTYETDDGTTETVEVDGVFVYANPVLPEADVTLTGDSLTVDIDHEASRVTIRF